MCEEECGFDSGVFLGVVVVDCVVLDVCVVEIVDGVFGGFFGVCGVYDFV